MPGPTDDEVRSVSGCQPGTLALRAAARSAYGVSDMGCYNPRNVRGGSSWSYHAGGRATDLGGTRAAMDACAEGLYARRLQLGIEELIYRRRIWTLARDAEGWRPYSGENPHEDHVHAGQSLAAARGLTAAQAATIIGGPPPSAGGPGLGFGGVGVGDIPIIGGAVDGLGTLVSLAEALRHLADPNFWKRVGLGALGVAVAVVGLILIYKDVAVGLVKDVAVNAVMD